MHQNKKVSWICNITGHILYFNEKCEFLEYLAHLGPLRGNNLFKNSEKIGPNSRNDTL